ncbi:MAG: hypothetical protein ACYDCF_09835 [Burkholderiales bacterium]
MKHFQSGPSQLFASSRRLVFRLLSGFMVMLAAPMAYAVPTIGQIGSYQQQTATGLAGGLYYFALFFGLLMVVVGIIMWGYAHKKHESPMVAIVIIIAGILLASVMAVIQSGSATVFQGSTQSQVQTLGLP